MTNKDEIGDLVRAYVNASNSDLFLFNAPILSGSQGPVDTFTSLIFDKTPRRPSVAVFLTTYGGDPDGAYRMIRCLRKSYQRVRLLIVGSCKSAGTLIAVGAHELAFAPTGELGPLDIQMVKPDEAGAYGSGLDIFTALTLLTSHAVEKFQEYTDTVLNGPLGNISTKTASDLAVRLAIGILNPIAAQIDPLRLGETQRAMDILREYAKRVGAETLNPGTLDKLIESYPTHGFVIDREEAARLFKKVDDLSSSECALATALAGTVRYPQRQPVVSDLGAEYPMPEAPDEADSQEASGGASDSASNGARPEGGQGTSDIRPFPPPADPARVVVS